jgi:predicted transcriptional regulator
MSRRKDNFVIRTRAHLAAIASPVRQEILDGVQALGPSSISEVAALLGRPADALYYHVRALERLGLVVRTGVRRNGRRDEAIFDVPARPLRIQYEQSDAANRAGATRAVAAAVRLTQRDFARALESGEFVGEGARRNAWGGRVKVWLTPAQLGELNRLIERISRISGRAERPKGSRLHSFAWLLAPVREAPTRRTRKENR